MSSSAALTAETVWHERLRRRLDPGTFDAKLRGLVHHLLAIEAGLPHHLEIVDGRVTGRHAIPTDRDAEKRRVLDELGITVGIGPKPCS